MSFTAYPSYHDNSIEWFGIVPSHWNVAPLKQVATLIAGQSPNSVDCNENGVGLPFLQGCAEFGDEHPTPRQYCEFPPKQALEGDLLLSVRAPVGELNSANQRYGIGRGLCAIRGTSRDTAFLRHVLSAAVKELQSVATGSTYQAVSSDQIGSLRIPVPSPDEQAVIAAFLDRETAKIDDLIAEKERLIELLEEKRQSVISHAVTKGLDPSAPMKDSGLEWSSLVPKSWEGLMLKRLFISVDYGISSALDAEVGIPVLRMSNIKQTTVNFNDLKFIGFVPDGLFVSAGDLLYNRTNSLDLVGQVGLVRKEPDMPTSFASYLVRMRVGKRARSSYLAYVLNHPGLLQLVRRMAFVAIGQANLNPTRYADLVLFMPGIHEQDEIVEFLDTETKKVDELRSEAQRAISLLSERRAALISAAVTGKIDVRGLVADLPPLQAAAE